MDESMIVEPRMDDPEVVTARPPLRTGMTAGPRYLGCGWGLEVSWPAREKVVRRGRNASARDASFIVAFYLFHHRSGPGGRGGRHPSHAGAMANGSGTKAPTRGTQSRSPPGTASHVAVVPAGPSRATACAGRTGGRRPRCVPRRPNAGVRACARVRSCAALSTQGPRPRRREPARPGLVSTVRWRQGPPFHARQTLGGR